ncbi:MAG: M10 family metallopeptidase C-terminal domain-containing protein [Rhodospirillales bacterium]|nr:M10 family metallopeptidase C-terminal domain-containing protein [Rhodospirillales bacterium]
MESFSQKGGMKPVSDASGMFTPAVVLSHKEKDIYHFDDDDILYGDGTSTSPAAGIENALLHIRQDGASHVPVTTGKKSNAGDTRNTVTQIEETIINDAPLYAPGGAATPAQFADYLVNGFWADAGSIARSWAQHNVTYSISNEFTAAQKAGLRDAFSMWQEIADITFSEVASGGDMDIVEGDDGRAYSSSSVFVGGDIASNMISIDTNVFGWGDLNTIGLYGLQTALHEIGHSLGLGHSGNYNGSATYNNDAIWTNDTRQFTIMSYFSASFTGANHMGQYGSTPQLIDMLAIQNIYGTNYATRSGNTIYGFNSNAGRAQYDFSITTQPIVAIWDGGGTDTLDLSGYGMAQTITLVSGDFSNVGGLTNNLVIAYGATIENATGGAGSDTIYGNDSDNILLGNNGNDVVFGTIGNDTLDGGGGTDTANYNYSVSAFAFNFINSVTVSFHHIVQNFTDVLSNFENFIFSDGSYTFAQLLANFGSLDTAPVLTSGDLTLARGEVTLASSVVTATDADGDTLTYEVWDGDTKSVSGYFELNGSKLAAGRGHTLTQAEFDALNIVGGSADSTDKLWVRVSDDSTTTAWQRFILTTSGSLAGGGGGGGGGGNAAPTVTASGLTLAKGEIALASSVITAADADGDTLSYEVWDGENKYVSGYFELNGAKLAASQSHILTQAEFDALHIMGGSADGTDKLWVRVSDGTHTATWQTFILTTSGSIAETGGNGGGVNTAPTVTASDFSLGKETAILASSVIIAADADGDALTYEVWDSGTNNVSGYFELNGVRLSAGGSHILTQAEFDVLNIVGGSAEGTDKLWAKVSDGTYASAWQSFIMTTTLPAGAATQETVIQDGGSAAMALDISDLIDFGSAEQDALDQLCSDEHTWENMSNAGTQNTAIAVETVTGGAEQGTALVDLLDVHNQGDQIL